jgi:GNAT superfamily N-acetyltransferase
VLLVTVEPGDLLDAVFTDVLAPAFPPDELITVAELRALARGTHSRVVAAVDDDGKPLGATVGEYSRGSGVLLLGYLAVRGDRRSGGVGGRLLEFSLAQWLTEFNPRMVLAEIEHPGAHKASAEHGDPVARLRFYARHGGRALPVPYFQPALTAEKSRVYGMILATLWIGPTGVGAEPDTVAAGLVREFLREYLLEAEGDAEGLVVPTDPPTEAIWRSLDAPGGLALLPLDQPDVLPISTSG